ncbi:hypothetical protein D3C85_1392240 [compost metagenome]
MKQRADYETEALKLSKAADIAIDAFKKFPPKDWNEETLLHIQNCYLEWKDNALYPEPKYKKIASLKYVIERIFTIFNEGSGDFVEYFWKEIKKQNLDYVREDKLWKVLKRGKINNRIEYEYVIDIIVPAEQENRITNEEAKLLSQMIGLFENKKKK